MIQQSQIGARACRSQPSNSLSRPGETNVMAGNGRGLSSRPSLRHKKQDTRTTKPSCRSCAVRLGCMSTGARADAEEACHLALMCIAAGYLLSRSRQYRCPARAPRARAATGEHSTRCRKGSRLLAKSPRPDLLAGAAQSVHGRHRQTGKRAHRRGP